MADECVVCGEAEEGKPLYKKLGSGEFNVEVITALKALQMVSIPEAAKNSSYICWDCDELIVEQYDRYLREQQAAAVVQKHTKKQQDQQQQQQQQQTKKKKKSRPSKLKLKISKDTKRDSSWGIAKPQLQKQGTKKPASVTNSGTSKVATSLSKTKQLEQQRATNAYHYSHCLMCDSNFETERRTYQRFSLKNRINDEMDIAQVMEVLGLARHIASDMKARRFVCNPCFFIIRRNYKDKVMKEASEEAKPLSLPSDPTSLGPQRAIHRATTEEHAAEIAKLLPPGLAECYKIVTENPVNKKHEMADTSEKIYADENSCQADEEEHDSNEEEGEEEEEEEEGALKVSQDEHGNYFIDILDKGCMGEKILAEQDEQPAILQVTRRKKNVLLPRRMHKHLSLSPQATPERQSDTLSGEENGDDKEEEEHKKISPSFAAAQELLNSRKCDICGITITGKPSSWWHTLTSPLEGFESISVTIALKLLETCLTRNQKVEEDQPVCLPCYSKVSSGFKSQVVQQIARHKNTDVNEVDLLRVKVRMLPKETPEPSKMPVQERVTEATESVEVLRSSDRSIGTCATQSMSEEGGEGEKENMDIEKHGQKRKLNEGNALSDKKRKLHRNEGDVTVMNALDSSEAETNQDCSSSEILTCTSVKKGRRSHCMRAKNGRFVKKDRIPGTKTSIVEEGSEQAESLVNNGQEENPQILPASQETLSKQNKEYKETEPLVVLKDLKFVLPQEAFSGKTVSSHKIESIIEPSKLLSPDQPLTSQSDLATTTSPLQLVFGALSTYHPPADGIRQGAPASSMSELLTAPKVNGCCVVCGCSYMVPLNSWHNVEENIRPPTLLVPVRWVCISLAISLPQVSVEDARLARVCENCFKRLGDFFEEFVKRKVGESCGLEAEAVDLSEYLFTFNTETMNLEADPKQQSYIHEFEDVGQLLQRIQGLMEQFSLDEVVVEGKRQPVLKEHFCVWLLLVLNELRMQVGAAIGDLACWLVALMPVDMYESGLRPCSNNLAAFLLNTTKCSKDLTEDVLEGPIPAWVFVSEDTLQSTRTDKVGMTNYNEDEDEDLCWEDFLQHVNLDALVGGKATPVSAIHFTQGLVYAVWRTSQLLREGEHQVVGWLRQLSPLPLSKEQLENLVTMIGQLHNHLEEHPEDIHELECAIIPQFQNEQCSSQAPSECEKVVGTPLSAQAFSSCLSEENKDTTQAYKSCKLKKDKNKSSELKKGKHNIRNTKKTSTVKNRERSLALSHKKNKRFKSLLLNMNANGQKSDLCQKAAVSSPSQTTPSFRDTQVSFSSHLDNDPDNCDATRVHGSTDATLSGPESVCNASATHTPLDLAIVCEPDLLNSEQCCAATTPTTSTVVTSRSSKGITPTVHLETETIPIIDPCKNFVGTSEPELDTVTTVEPPGETGILEETTTNAEVDEDTAPITGTSEEAAATIEPQEKALLVSETSETVAVIGTLEKTAVSTEFGAAAVNTVLSCEETIPTNEPLQQTYPTSQISKETIGTTESYKENAALTSVLKDTVATSGTSEKSTSATKHAADTVTITEASERNASFMEPIEGTIVTIKPGEKSTTLSGTSAETAVTSGILEKPALTTGTSEETAVTSGIMEKAAVISGTSGKTKVTSGTSEKTIVIGGASRKAVVTNGTSEKTTLISGTSEETILTTETLEKIAVTTETTEKAAVTRGTSDLTATLHESLEEAPTIKKSLENISVNTTELASEISATSLKETGASNEITGKTAPTSKQCEEIETTTTTPEELVPSSKVTKITVINTESAEKIAYTTKAFEVPVTLPDHLEGTLTTLGLRQVTIATCELPGDTTITAQETTASGKMVATNGHSEKNVNTAVHSKENTMTTTALSSVARNIITATTCTNASHHGMNAVTTTTQATASLPFTNTQVTPDTGDTANSTQVTNVPLEVVSTKTTKFGSVEAETSKPHLIECATTLIKTLGSSTTLVSPPNKNSLDVIRHSVVKVSQNEIFSEKTSSKFSGQGSPVILKKTNGNSQNPTNSQRSALRKSPEAQIEFEQKNEYHVNLKQNGSSPSSKRTITGMSNTPKKFCTVTVPKGKEKDSLQMLHKYKIDAPLKKTVVVPSARNSKDTDLIASKKKLTQEVPIVVSRTKPSLHRSERVSIRVLSSEVKIPEGHKAENLAGTKTESVWLYQNPCKESRRTEKVDNKTSHLGTREEGRESNNNTEIPPPVLQGSSKGVVKLVSAGHIRDTLKHISKNEKYKPEHTNMSIVQNVNKKVPVLNNTRQRNLCIERIPGSGDKIPAASVKKVKDTNIENNCVSEKVDEMPESSTHEKIKANKKYHKPVTGKSPKGEVHEKKKSGEKTPGKSLFVEGNKQSQKGKISPPLTRPERSVCKSPCGVTPSKQGTACRTPKGLPEKKQKLTFEELMNYDATGIGHS